MRLLKLKVSFCIRTVSTNVVDVDIECSESGLHVLYVQCVYIYCKVYLQYVIVKKSCIGYVRTSKDSAKFFAKVARLTIYYITILNGIIKLFIDRQLKCFE